MTTMLPTDLYGDIPLLRPQGRFDAYLVPLINETLAAIFEDSDTPRVIVNFVQVSFIDAAALQALTEWVEKAREQGGDIKLSSLRHTVRMRLDMQHLSVFEIYETDAEAGAAFRDANDEDESEDGA